MEKSVTSHSKRREKGKEGKTELSSCLRLHVVRAADVVLSTPSTRSFSGRCLWPRMLKEEPNHFLCCLLLLLFKKKACNRCKYILVLLSAVFINLICLQHGIIRALRALIDLNCTEQPQLGSFHLLGSVKGVLRQDDRDSRSFPITRACYFHTMFREHLA